MHLLNNLFGNIYGQSNATFVNSSTQNEYVAFKNDIINKINSMQTKPSFSDSTVTVEVGQTTTLTDSNGVLAQYTSIDKTINGIRFLHNYGENTIAITVNEDCTVEDYRITDTMMEEWGLIKEQTRNYDTTLYIEFPGDVQNQIYSLHYNDPVSMALNLKVNMLGNLELTKLDTDKNLIDGATFRVTGPDNFNQLVTVTNGKIKLEKLKKGVYTIKEENAPEGYLLNAETYNVEIKPNETATQAIVNEEPTGTFTLVKKNADGTATLEGTKYRIWNNNGYDKEFTTDKNGEITVTGLELGTYNYKETFAINGYLLDTKTYSFELKYKDQYTSVVYANAERTNTEPTGTITILKKDSETGTTPQGDATLEGAKYEVYADEDIYNKAKTKKFYSKGDLVATRTMDKNGKTTDITELPLGKYRVKETVSSLGYLIDTKEYAVNLQYKDQNTKIISTTVTSNEVVKKMQVHIFKSGIKEQSGQVKGLEGAEFTIKLNSDVENAYENGYSYAEVWNGIDEYGNATSVDKNRVAKAQEIAPTYEIITTNENGDAYTQNKLPYGKYIVKETKTPKDFESAEDFTFSITQDESEIKEVAQKVKHLIVNNEQLETYIKLIKKDLKTNKTVTLNSATFEIKATTDIYDRGNGKIIYKKGETIKQKIGSTTYSTFTTNADNIVVPDNSYNTENDNKGTVTTPLMLEVGSYEITEIKTPNGFLQLDKPVQFKVDGIRDYDKDQDGDYIKEITIKNEQPTGTLIVDKSIALREDIDTSLVDVSDLSGIQFKLTAKEDVISAIDGSVIYKKGQEIDKYNLDKNGNLKIENLPMGIYELQEIKTLDGLVLNNTKYEVEFTQKDLITKVYEVKQDISNDTTVVEFSKQDITGEKELVGAKLTIIDENNKIVDSWTSTEKNHKIEGLVVGKTYTLREEIAPDGYVRATDIQFKIEDTKEIQKVKMIDKMVTMSKLDIGGNEVEGAEIKVTDKDGNIIDSWTSGKESHNIKGLDEGKTYILHEDYAPNGFVVSTEVEFTVTTDKETQKVEMIDKIVEISKVDIAGDEIEGATLVVTNTKTKQIVDKWVSGKEPHRVNGLIEGQTYILHEEIVADGYVKATDIEFTVTTDKEIQKIEMIDKVVEIVKTDLVTGKELEGAELKVTDLDGNVIDTWTSTKEPHVVVGLEENKTYKLIEVTAPYGYEITEEIEFTVTTDKETQKIEMKDMPILKDVKVVKVNSKTKEIIKEKFTFGIYENAECTKLIKKIESNKRDGFVTFEDLRYGTYFIKEINAPKGYVLSNEIIKVEINDKGVFVNDNLIEEKDEVYSFEFENVLMDTPKTSDERNTMFFVIAFIISTLGITTISIVKYKKRKKKQ